MIQTLRHRLLKLRAKAAHANTLSEIGISLAELDNLYLDIFALSNESFEKARSPDFIDELQRLEFEVAEIKLELARKYDRN